MQEELSELYTAAGHYREAMGMHEKILRAIVEGDDGDDKTTDVVSAAVGRKHVEFLKRAHIRLGGWDKEEQIYRGLVEAVKGMFNGSEEFKNLQGVEKWRREEKDDGMGTFLIPEEWGFASKEDLDEKEKPENGGMNGAKRKKRPAGRPGLGMKRASSNWGLGTVHRLLFSEDDHEDIAHRKKGRPKEQGH